MIANLKRKSLILMTDWFDKLMITIAVITVIIFVIVVGI